MRIWNATLLTGRSDRKEHELIVAGEAMPLAVIRHPRARRMRLRYDSAAGSLKLTVPPRASLRSALAWAGEQQDWIVAQRAKSAMVTQVADDAVIPVEGVDTHIVWSETAPRTPVLSDGALTLGGPHERVSERVQRWLKARAKATLSAETFDLAQRHGLSSLQAVGIGDPRSRWGSCAANGVIRYSWRLILAPAHVRLATVAHEVAHLVHMHHGPEFHALVRQISASDPDVARAWLKREGAGLHRYIF